MLIFKSSLFILLTISFFSSESQNHWISLHILVFIFILLCISLFQQQNSNSSNFAELIFELSLFIFVDDQLFPIEKVKIFGFCFIFWFSFHLLIINLFQLLWNRFCQFLRKKLIFLKMKNVCSSVQENPKTLSDVCWKTRFELYLSILLDINSFLNEIQNFLISLYIQPIILILLNIILSFNEYDKMSQIRNNCTYFLFVHTWHRIRMCQLSLKYSVVSDGWYLNGFLSSAFRRCSYLNLG